MFAGQAGSVQGDNGGGCMEDRFWIVAIVLAVMLVLVTMVTLYVFYRLRREQHINDKAINAPKNGFHNPAF